MVNRITNKESWQYFKSIEDIYKKRMGAFLALASKHVYNRDHAIDVVHNALAKAVIYFKKNPDRKVRERIIQMHILKECGKLNRKQSKEIAWGVFNEPDWD